MTGSPESELQVGADELFEELVSEDHGYVLCSGEAQEDRTSTSSCLGRVVPRERILEIAPTDSIDELVAGLPDDTRVFAICPRGETSHDRALELQDRGVRVSWLAGGLRSWIELCVVRPLVLETHLQIHQVLRPSLGVLSYVVISGRSVLVIDPQRFVQPYTHLAAQRGLRVTSVLDTHLHSDHVSGAARVAAVARAPEFLHPFDGINLADRSLVHYPFEFLIDGRQYPIGSSRFRVLHLPGHTLGHSGILLNERYLFCGETLLLSGLPIPDVTSSGEEWSRLLFASVRRLALLPDDTVVFPGRFTTPRDVGAERGIQGRLAELRDSETLRLAERGESAFVDAIQERWQDSWADVHVEILRVNARQRTVADEAELTELESGAGGFAMPAGNDA